MSTENSPDAVMIDGPSAATDTRGPTTSDNNPQAENKEDSAAVRETLNGCWILDKTRGEWSMRHYLEVMGVNELAIKAHEKGENEFETFHTIELDATKVKIVKRSRVNADLTVDVPLGQEQVEYLPPGDREKKILAESDNLGHLRIKSSLHTINGLAHVIDEKKLVHPVDGDPNKSMIVQTLTITNAQNGQTHSTTRYFIPYLKTPPHLE